MRGRDALRALLHPPAPPLTSSPLSRTRRARGGLPGAVPPLVFSVRRRGIGSDLCVLKITVTGRVVLLMDLCYLMKVKCTMHISYLDHCYAMITIIDLLIFIVLIGVCLNIIILRYLHQIKVSLLYDH